MSRTKRTQRGRRTELSEHQTLETRLEHYRREGKEHRMRTLIWGTVGSIMIMLGSYGSGWLADSSDFWRSSIIRTIRYDPSWIIACVVLVAAGGRRGLSSRPTRSRLIYAEIPPSCVPIHSFQPVAARE